MRSIITPTQEKAMPSREFRRANQRKGDTVSGEIEKRKGQHPAIYAFSVIILVIIVVTFVLAGPGGPLSRGGAGNSGNVVFGTYNGQEIAYYQGSYFAQQRDYIANQYKQQASNSQENLAFIQMIWYQAFLNTAEHVAILDMAKKAGVTLSEDAVDKSLLKYSAYLDEEGKFSETRYNAVSSADRAATRKLTREDLTSSVVIQDIASGVKGGAKESAFVKDMIRQERSFSFVSFPFSSFPVEEVQKYGQANKSRFMKVKVSRILVKSGESQAKEIRKKLADKTSSFEELAKTYSKDSYADKGGDMGWRYAYDLEADFEAKETAQKVLTLKTGEYSDVLKGTFGWMVYRCDAEAVDADFSNETVQADVRKYITTYEKGKIEDYFNERAGQLSRAAAEKGFDKACRDMGLKVIATEPFPVNLSSVFSFAPVQAIPDTETPTAAASSEDFFYRAFTLGKDQVSAPVVLDDQVIVLKVKEERQMPDSTLALMDQWIPYMANQTLQGDLSAALMTADKFKDDFSTAFASLYPASSKQ
jgi:peptidyl-prolyl cis-trans isomerase D